MLAVALVLVLVVVGYVVINLTAPPPSASGPKQHPAMVIIAANPLPVGTLIKPQDLTFGPRPADALPGTVFDRIWADDDAGQAAADGRAQTEVIGAVSRRRIEQGDPITKAAVVKPGDSGFLAAVLRPGMRAVTVAVTVVTGTAGLIYPGDHVDMILTTNFSSTKGVDMSGPTLGLKTASETIAADLRVLAIDQQLQVKTDPNNPNASGPGKVAATVTLEVDPDAANRIEVASKVGELTLTIRALEGSGGAAATAPAPAAGGDEAATPVWAHDVSNAVKAIEKAALKAEPPAEPAKPKILVIRGPQAETSGVH
jgi:pilus assembly protein CpaB